MENQNFRFEPLTVVLRASGWSPERRVDLGSIEQKLAERGFQLHPLIKPIIESFDGLKIKSSIAWIKFDAEWAATAYNSGHLRLLDSITGGPLSPLGQVSCAGVFGSASGQIFGLDLDWIQVTSALCIESFLTSILFRETKEIKTILLRDHQKPDHLR